LNMAYEKCHSLYIKTTALAVEAEVMVLEWWRWWWCWACSIGCGGVGFGHVGLAVVVTRLMIMMLLLLNISNLMGNEAPAYWHALVLSMRNIMYVSALAHTFHKNSN